MSLIRYAAALLLLVFLVSPATAAKRNIVLFVTDDQSPTMGCYGDPVIQTPNMDKLAADGTLFNYAFCTTASCSASRSVILSGMHNHANGHYGHQHDFHKFSAYQNIKSLPSFLEMAGYRTGRIGKYHVAPESVYYFQEVFNANSRSPIEMADKIRGFISEKTDEPFFLYFATSDPHRGGGKATEIPTKPDRFGNKAPGATGYPGINEITYDPKDVIIPHFLPDSEASRDELVQYYQSISRIDQGLGQLIKNLKEAGVYDDTLIMYISDHGMAFPGGKTTLYEGGMRSPLLVRNPYQQNKGVRNNALVSWVDLTPTLLDFAGVLDKRTGKVKTKVYDPAKDNAKYDRSRMTTRLDKEAYAFHGRSFLSILDQENPKKWDEVFASHTFHEITMYYPMKVVRGRKWKLIWNIAHGLPYPFASDLWAASTWQDRYKYGPDAMYGQRTVDAYINRPAFELFDLENDPYESKNLADDPQYAGVLKEYQAKIKTYQRNTNDRWILKWDYE